MMPRRSSALTAREAVSRVVDTRSARSDRIGLGRIVRSALCRAWRSNSACTRPTADKATCSYMRDAVCWSRSTITLRSARPMQPCCSASKASDAAFEQEGRHRFHRDDVGVVPCRIRRADHAEEVARPIFVEEDHLAVQRIDDRMRAAGDDDIKGRYPVALPHDRRAALEIAEPAAKQNVAGQIERTIENAAQQAPNGFVRRSAAAIPDALDHARTITMFQVRRNVICSRLILPDRRIRFAGPMRRSRPRAASRRRRPSARR